MSLCYTKSKVTESRMIRHSVWIFGSFSCSHSYLFHHNALVVSNTSERPFCASDESKDANGSHLPRSPSFVCRRSVDLQSQFTCHGGVSLCACSKQHDNYINVLKQHVPTMIVLPALENHPDCVFVEDTVVAIEDTVYLTRPGAKSRQGEVESIKNALKGVVGIKHTQDMREYPPEVLCDGGDAVYRTTFVRGAFQPNE
jgi:hypothetical protein